MRFLTALLLALGLLTAGAASAQDPIDRPVTREELSLSYKKHSKALTNVEYDISRAVGSAQSAVGTRFHRGEASFEIVGERERTDTYDPDINDIFERVIYLAKELISGPLVANGRELAVAIDYRRTTVVAEPQPGYFQAYVAEVKRGKVPAEEERWEFKKTSRP